MFRRSKSAISYQLSAISLIIVMAVSASYARELIPQEATDGRTMSKEPIIVDGDRVEYFQDQKKAVGTGNVSIKYKDMVLTCDRITVYLDTREGIAEGNVRITQKDSFVTGDRINYNFDTRKAAAIDGYIAYKPFYGRAREVDKLANKDQYSLQRGYITTCDLDRPHYRVQTRHIEIYMNDKIVAKNIILFVGDMPVFYLPYYVHPLRDTKSHVALTTGEKDEWGYYALTSTRLCFGDKGRADLLLDYRGRLGFAEGINYYYETRAGEGAIKFYYTTENVNYLNDWYDRSGDMRKRYRWQWRHKWDMGKDTGTVATVEFNRLRDRYIIKDYFYNEYEELGDNPDNFVSVITAKPTFTARLLAKKRFGKFYDVIERLPEYTIEVPQYNLIPKTPIYYTGSASAIYFNHTYDNSNTSTIYGQKDVWTGRVDTYNKLSYAFNFFKSLHITPYAATRQTYYSRNKWGDTNEIRGVFDSGVDGSIKFYRLFDIETNFLGLDIHKLRHIITPTAGYYNTHQPTIDTANLNQFDAVDSIATANGANFALENRLQTKKDVGGSLQSVDIATFLVSTNYTFRLKKNRLAMKNHTQKFQDVNMLLEVKPYSWLTSVARMTVNTKNYAVSRESLDFILTAGDRLAFDLGHIYEKADEFNTHNELRTQAVYKLNDKWRVRAYQRFNVDKSFMEQEYTIYRDLHCWRAELIYRLRKQPHEVGLFLTFTMKAFPEYPIGYKRTYSQPQFGNSASANFGKIDTIGEGEERLVPADNFMLP